MTMVDERLRAINNTRDFLRALLDPKKTPKVPRWIRVEARWMLKHYPWECHVDKLEKKCVCGVFK